jgi:tryptophan halogenase
MGEAELDNFLKGIRNKVDDSVQRLPSHRDYLAKYCPAKAM